MSVRVEIDGAHWGGGDNPSLSIRKLREQIDVLSKGEITEQSKDEVAKLQAELEHVYMDEEIYWRQRSKNQWTQEGDRNTRFFHAKASQQKRMNSISGLYNSEGEWKEEVEDVERIILSYFGGLFQTSNPAPAIIDEVLEAVSLVVTQDMNRSLTATFFSSIGMFLVRMFHLAFLIF